MRTTFEHRFVELIPEVLDEGVLYISVTYTTALHKCACGCGRFVNLRSINDPFDASAHSFGSACGSGADGSAKESAG